MNQQEQKLELARVISKALGEDQPTPIATFLEKFYKKNLSEKSRINQVRLSRYNTLLYKFSIDINNHTDADLTTYYIALFSFVSKSANLSDGEDHLRLLTATYYWIAKNLSKSIISIRGALLVIDFLDFLLNDKKLQITKQEQFSAMIRISPFFKSVELSMDQEIIANKSQTDEIVLQSQSLAISILNKIDVILLFKNLIKYYSDLSKLADLAFQILKRTERQAKFEWFQNIFVKNINLQIVENRQNIVKILNRLLQSNQFEVIGIKRLKRIIDEINLNLYPLGPDFQKKLTVKQLSELIIRVNNIDMLKTIITKNVTGKIQDLISLFQNNTKPSYFLLQLILKTKQNIPKSKLVDFSQLSAITNRNGIVLALLFSQQKKNMTSQLLKYYNQIKQPSPYQKLIYLQLLHFSLQQQPNQCQLFTNFIAEIPPSSLNDPCVFSFLPLNPLQKVKIDKLEKSTILNLLNQNNDNSERIYKMKIDLYSYIGESIPLLNNIESVMKLAAKKKEELIENLPNLSEQIIEVVLMRINNLLEQRYVDQINPKVIQWAVKLYNKDQTKYRKLIKQYLSNLNLENYLSILLSLKNLNQSKKNNPIIIKGLQEIMAQPKDNFRLKGENYSNFFIQVQKRTSLLDNIHHLESRMFQIYNFLKVLDQKIVNKKQIKKILVNYNSPIIFALQSLHFYTKQNLNDKELLLGILSVIEPDVQIIENTEKKVADLELQTYDIQNYLDNLLGQVYQQAIYFIWKIMKSKSPVEQKIVKRKKNKAKKQGSQLATRIISAILEFLPILLNKPQRLKDLTQIIQIICKLIQKNDDHEDLAENIINWMKQLTTMNWENNNLLLQKIKSIRFLWEKIYKFLKNHISVNELKYQFKFVSDLYINIPLDNAQYELLETQILTTIFIIGSTQPKQTMEIQFQEFNIPKDRLSTLIPNRLKPTFSEIMHFYCQQCGKNICQTCANFLHRNHDKNYVLKEKGSCSNHEVEKKRLRSQQYEQMLRYESLGELNSHRANQIKKMLIQKSNRNQEEERRQWKKNENNAYGSEQQHQDDSEFQIKSTSDISIVDLANTNKHKLYHQCFIGNDNYSNKNSNNNIGSQPILKNMIRDIQQYIPTQNSQNNHSQEIGSLQKFFFDSIVYGCTMEILNDKCAIIKSTTFRTNHFDARDLSGYQRRGRGGLYNNINKTLILSNTKITAIIANSAVTVLNQAKLRRSVKRREKTKNYNAVGGQSENAGLSNTISINFEIITACFSKSNPSLLAVVGPNQFQVYSISNQGKYSKKTNYNLALGSEYLLKFQFLPQTHNIVIIMTIKQIRLYELSMDNNPRVILRFLCQKQYKDFTCNKYYQSSKGMYQLFACDNQGNLYYERFNLSSQKTINLTNKLLSPDRKDSVTGILVSPMKDLGLITYKQGSNLLFKVQNGKILKTAKLNLLKICPQNSDLFMALDRMGYSMFNTKEIYVSKQAAVYACCLKRDSADRSSNGSFAIIQLFGTNSLHIQFMNDNSKTEAFEVIPYEDQGQSQKFIIIGMHNDGTLWFKVYELKKSFITLQASSNTNLVINDEKINIYNKLILDKGLLGYIKERGGRCTQFKQFGKIQSIPTISNNIIKHTFKTNFFVTGVTIKFSDVIQGKVGLTLFNNKYQFDVKGQRQIQLPLSMKQSLTTFIEKVVEIKTSQPYQYSTFDSYGISWQRPSTYLDIYKKLVKICVDHFHSNKVDIENYFTNSLRQDFFINSTEEINKLLKQARFDQSHINFIYKLQLSCQVLDAIQNSITINQIEQYIQQVKKLFFIQKLHAKTSAKRLLKKLFQLYKKKSPTLIIMGDPFQYYTFKDLLYINKLHNNFVEHNSLTSFDTLLLRLQKILTKRLANLYLIFALFPTLIWKICDYFKNDIGKSIQISNRIRINQRISIIIKIMCEYYHYMINSTTNIKQSQSDMFRLLEVVLGGMAKNKEIYKELVLKSVQYLETLPYGESVTKFDYGCDLFKIKSSEVINKNIIRYQPQPVQIQPLEQYKQIEQDQSQMRIQEQQEEIPFQIKNTNSVQIQPSNVFYNFCDSSVIKQSNYLNILTSVKKINKVQVVSKDIVYQLIIAMLQQQNLINKDNSNYYIGLMFNLVTLLDCKIIHYEQDVQKKMIQKLLKLLEIRLSDGKTPCLFMVLAYFVQPDYEIISIKKRQKKQMKKNLNRFIIDYYTVNKNYPMNLFFNQTYPEIGIKQGNLKGALSFKDFSLTTHRFQIKFLSNIYLTLIDQGIRVPPLIDKPQNLRENILKGFVISKLRVLKNIIIIEGWQLFVESTIFEVGFEEIQNNEIQKGLQRILDTIQKDPDNFGEYMISSTKIEILENLFDNEVVKRKYLEKLMKIIQIYYENL